MFSRSSKFRLFIFRSIPQTDTRTAIHSQASIERAVESEKIEIEKAVGKEDKIVHGRTTGANTKTGSSLTPPAERLHRHASDHGERFEQRREA